MGGVFRSGDPATTNPAHTHPAGVFVISGPTLRTVDASEVPEPSSMALAISGLVALVATRRRQARN